MKSIKSTIINTVLILLFAVVTFLIWQHNKDTIDAKNVKIESLESTAIIQDKTIETLVLSDEKTHEKQEVLEEVIVKNLGEQTKVQVQIRSKIEAIDKKYATMETDPVTVGLRIKEISLERARGVWASYCIELPKAEECQDLK